MIPLSALPLALALVAAPDATRAPCADVAGPARDWCEEVAPRPRLPLPSPGDRAALREVYARPELSRARADPAALRRLVARLWFRLVDLLGSAEAERYASVGRTVFILAVVATGLAAFAAARRRRFQARVAPASPERERAPLPPPDRSAELAQGALARGDGPAAVRLAFLSALAALEESGRLPRDRTQTNGELAMRLGAAGALDREFGALGRTFDGVLYGRATVSAQQARDAVESAHRIRAALGGPG